MDNYDPNMTSSGRMAVQTVELVFQLWDYKATYVQTVGGNCTGLTVIETAVSNVYESLPNSELVSEEDDCAELKLTKIGGDEILTCCDEDERGEDWLRDMLVSATIISIEPDTRTN